ncbi:MAG: transmembrane 9 family protein [archaeon]|nr:transmembrane 9 family protein [archaeon]
MELIEGHDLTFEFSYSVAWHETELLYSDRMSLVDRDPNHGQELKIRWLGILNSSVLVVFLTGFVAVILFRVLKSDYTRYRRREHLKPGEDDDEPDDYGWKLVHGDIFRFPQHTLLFCSLLGVGAQFLVLALFSILLALSGIVSFYNPGGSAYTAALLLYSLTAVIAGLVSSYFFTQMEGQKWAWCVVLTSTLFSIPFFLLGVVLNLIAASYDSTSALSLGAIFLVVCIWLLVGFPLTLVGAIAGRHLAPPFEAPTRTNHFPRQIPEAPWYRRTAPMMVFAGFLPFSAIYIELYFIYYSVWGHHHYSLYGLLLLVFAILVTVTSCVTISLTYFQLAMEDHQWWWRSFLNGASTGLFIYGYSFYYYFFTSQMTGFLQASFFFVRMFLVSYIFWIMLGTVGFLASLKFVRQIYSNIKFA